MVRYNLILVILSVGLIACGDGKEAARKIDALQRNVEDLISSNDTLKNLSTEDASTELKKLRQFEYRIFSLPAGVNDDQIEAALNLHGKNFWECFDVERVSKEEGVELRFFCKRKPETLLRYLPQTLLGR